MKNKHGLNRDPSPNVKYTIRKDDYFGCVHCGLGIYDYEHIDPEFPDAKEHDPKKMTLLCPTENQKVRRKFTSKETVWKWKKNAWSKTHGHCHDKFDITNDKLEIWVGSAKVIGYEKILNIDNECILSVQPPEEVGAPYRLSAVFHDNRSEPILEIKDNVWKAKSDAFDIVSSEGKMGIRKDGKFALKIYTYPPNKIVIEEIDMLYKGVKIQGDANKITFTSPKGGGMNFESKVAFTFTGLTDSLLTVSTEKSGISIGAGIMDGITEPRPTKSATVHKFRRNEFCPCGSGKKYKDCCKTKYDYTL